jgi:hypothetical protein
MYVGVTWGAVSLQRLLTCYEVNDVKILNIHSSDENRGAQIFQKPGSHLKILDA